MRCPKCKKTLIKGKRKRYETLVEHVSNPNQKSYPLRPTYVCPNECFGKEQFFGYFGASYRDHRQRIKYWNALDSPAREAEIKTMLDMRYASWRGRLSALKELKIKGEKDIPPMWTWLFYWLKGKLIRILRKIEYRMRGHK